jgi:hypothetical protein
MTTETETKIRVRLDGCLDGVHGPSFCLAHRRAIAEVMGWEDGGKAIPVITRTLEMLAEGKSVKLTSRHGYCYWQPLADDEDGLMLPRSHAEVFDADGNLIQRLATA